MCIWGRKEPLDVPRHGNTILVEAQMFAIENFRPAKLCFQSTYDRKHRFEMNRKNRESIMDDKTTACRKDVLSYFTTMPLPQKRRKLQMENVERKTQQQTE